MAVQNIGYGVVMPTYYGMHLLFSSTKSIRPLDVPSILILPISIMLGYILPTVLMSLPWLDPSVHQYLVAIWQVFPLWITMLQYALKKAYSYLSHHHKSEIGRFPASEIKSLDRVYRFSFAPAMLTQVLTVGLIACAQSDAPFNLLSDHDITFCGVFLPPNFRQEVQIRDMIQGAHGMFQYDQYVGSLAAIVWAVTVRLDASEASMSFRQLVELTLQVISYTLLAGPAGAIIILLWARDLQILRNPNLETKSKNT